MKILSPKTLCQNFWPGLIILSKSVCSSVGPVYRSCPSICTGINTAIANPISLVSIHRVPVQYQHTLICISPKMARDPTSLVLGFEYQSAYQCCTFRVAFSPGINLAMIMCFRLYSFSYFEFALNLFGSEVGCSLAEPSKHVSCFFLFFNICNVVFIFQP